MMLLRILLVQSQFLEMVAQNGKSNQKDSPLGVHISATVRLQILRKDLIFLSQMSSPTSTNLTNLKEKKKYMEKIGKTMSKKYFPMGQT